MSQLGPDPERISILDDHGHRRFVIPAEVKGIYRKRKNYVHTALILLFLILPWLEINGHQALLLDISHREFSFFGLKLYAHDAPLIFFVFAVAVFGLALATAVWGRIWCGWACPQTVFIDTLFRRIEVWTEGNYMERRRMHNSPLTASAAFKTSLKWFLYLVLSSLIAHSFSAYFVGSRELLRMMNGSPADNWSYFLWISSFTIMIAFDFGWFREQFCIIMCPYGRFQGLLMDSKSMAVLYDEKRGEPRKGSEEAKLNPDKKGDCVSCRRCVEVCPTGIDIRKGLQMECIACTACMDACDEIMTKVKKPTGLIRYANLEGGTWSFVRPRTLVYALLVSLSLIGLGVSLWKRSSVDVVLLRGQDALFQKLQGATPDQDLLLNQMRLHLKNQSGHKLELKVEAETLGGQKLELAIPQNPIHLAPNEDLRFPLFVKFPPSLLGPGGQTPAVLKLEDENLKLTRPFKLLGPN